MTEEGSLADRVESIRTHVLYARQSPSEWGAISTNRYADDVETLLGIIADYEDGITWGTSCLSCAKMLNQMVAADAKVDNAKKTLRDLDIRLQVAKDLCLRPAQLCTNGMREVIQAIRAALEG